MDIGGLSYASSTHSFNGMKDNRLLLIASRGGKVQDGLLLDRLLPPYDSLIGDDRIEWIKFGMDHHFILPSELEGSSLSIAIAYSILLCLGTLIQIQEVLSDPFLNVDTSSLRGSRLGSRSVIR